MEGAEKMTGKQLAGFILLGVTVSCGCKRNYAPPVVTTDHNYLVVEGVISAGGDSTIVKLSRTIQISETNKHRYEIGANVVVNDDQGAFYPLTEVDSGRYTAPAISDASRKYRLNITTTDGKTYQSDLVPVGMTPPLDSVEFEAVSNDVNIYADTRDATNKTKYYRWDYVETYIWESIKDEPWEFDNSYNAVSNKFRLRTPAEQVHLCYDTKDASAILVASAANLKQSVINKFPITQIASTDERIVHKYSIVVKQYAITSEAYNFWAQVKKNTEQIGTIFDVQPSEIQGNIHCTSNPGVPVVGYVSASTVSQKRIFIDRTMLPAWPILPQTEPCAYEDKPTPPTWHGHNIPSDITSGVWIPTDSVRKIYDPLTKDTIFSVIPVIYNCVDC
ncbi:MAG: DUF4249 domain-containing protein, partial [Mucilaginibacter sp.]